MAGQDKKGFVRIINAFGYSLQGFRAVFIHEEAFRQELFMAVAMIPLALFVGDSAAEKALLIGSVLWVLIVEILNSAIEAVVDRFGGEWHELSKRSKDMGSAAVFLSIATMAVIWLVIIIY